MANRYGEAALLASAPQKLKLPPRVRWQTAMNELYPSSAAAREKGGPRNAYLGLCEAGMVVGVSTKEDAASRKSMNYAVRAAELLLANQQHWSISALWSAVCDDPKRKHTGQMDVVMALYKNHRLQEAKPE